MIKNISSGICENKHKYEYLVQTGCNGTCFNILKVKSFMVIVSMF